MWPIEQTKTARHSTLHCANTSTCSGAEHDLHANPWRPGAGFGVTLDSAAAGFVLIAVVMGFAATPAFRFLDHAPEQGARYAAVDGLRGFLALGVFLTHLFLTHRFIETGVWEPPTSRLYTLLGAVGVSAFFMLTGFLFWGKLLRSRGRPGWRALYVGRLFRIAPMYLCVISVMLLIVFARTGFELREPAGVVLGSALQWLALGFIGTQPDVNGYAASNVVAGVTWTITYEWAFYGLLVVMAPLSRHRAHLAFVLTALVVFLAVKSLWQVDAAGFAALFACGMAVASLMHMAPALRLPDKLSSAVALLCLVAILGFSSSGYSTWTAMLLTLFVFLVCTGATLFGLLATTAAQRLGRVSYSLYLMQGVALSLVFAVAPMRAFAMTSPVAFWAVGIVCACLLVLAASLGYALVEHPGIALGKRLMLRAELERPVRNPVAAASGRGS